MDRGEEKKKAHSIGQTKRNKLKSDKGGGRATVIARNRVSREHCKKYFFGEGKKKKDRAPDLGPHMCQSRATNGEYGEKKHFNDPYW